MQYRPGHAYIAGVQPAVRSAAFKLVRAVFARCPSV